MILALVIGPVGCHVTQATNENFSGTDGQLLGERILLPVKLASRQLCFPPQEVSTAGGKNEAEKQSRLRPAEMRDSQRDGEIPSSSPQGPGSFRSLCLRCVLQALTRDRAGLVPFSFSSFGIDFDPLQIKPP